jgi:dTDP-4-amino-4,6-dideoxygalactose transaminase
MYATTAILAIGAEPFFLDTDPVTRCIAPDEVERALAAGVRAVVATHLYGLAIPQIAIIAALCRARGVPLLEDCAQAHGASVAGRRAGSFGNAASFSFYPTKNLGALGDGGAVATNDLAAADKVERLRQYGWSAKYRAELPGARNSRLDELQAAVLAALLPGLDEANARRREIAAMYSKGIIHPRVVVPPHCGTGYVAHLYVVESDDRDGLRDHLRQNGIAADVHYPLPDHRQQVFDGRFAQVSLPVAERLAGAVLTLPCYPEMTDSEAQTVVHAINRWPTG